MTRISRTSLADLGVLSLLSLLGIAGLESSFGDLDFLFAAFGGVVVGTLAAVAGSLWRLGVLPTVAVALAAYFLLGTPFTMPSEGLFLVLPSLASLAGLALGAVYGWADIVTISAPVEAPYYLAVLPYFAAWLVSLVGTMLALRWLPKRRTALRALVLLIGPVLLYTASILLGTDEPFYAGVRGVAFAAIALVWIAWRRGATVEASGDGASRLRRRKLAGSAAVVAGAVVLGALGGLLLAPITPERFVLRDEVVPPFDPEEYSSPLAGFRNYTKDLVEEPLFEVSGLEPGDSLRLASMDAYTGRLWSIAGPGDAANDGGYAIVGEQLPRPSLARLTDKRLIDVTIEGYDDVWLPTIGYGSDLEVLDAETKAELAGLRYNADAGTAVLDGGVDAGTHYRLTSYLQQQPDPEDLRNTPVARVALAPIDILPDVVAAKAEEYAGDAATPIEQIQAIEEQLRTNGFLSHGLGSDSAPSRAGHGADRLIELFTKSELVGDDEQYAAAMALMVRQLGYPARVVMGFVPEIPDDAASVQVTGADVAAWVEVPFEGTGWVAFHPTPENIDAPQQEVPKPQSEPQPQVRQPPRAEHVEDDLLATVEIDDIEEEDPEPPFRIPGWVWVVGASVLIPAAIVFLPLLLVGMIKAARRRRRRRAVGERASVGAWDELVDRYAELGFEPPEKATRLQTARALEQQLGEQGLAPHEAPRLAMIAATVDRDVFGGDGIDDASVEARWTEADAALAAVNRVSGRVRRVIARYRIRRGR